MMRTTPLFVIHDCMRVFSPALLFEIPDRVVVSLDEREKLRAATGRAPMVKGSHEQLMLNPLFRRIRELNREIAWAEEQFGMTPLARLRLGVRCLQERAAADELEERRKRRQPHRME